MASPSEKSTTTASTQHSRTEEYQFGNWRFVATQSHIQKSICICNRRRKLSSGSGDEETSASPNVSVTSTTEQTGDICQLCYYEEELSNLTQLPEMIFSGNSLTVQNTKTGAILRFDTLNALKSVLAGHDPNVKVKASQQWLDARKDCPFVKNTIKKPYDWTFTPHYGGDLENFKAVEPTDEQIDIEKLKIREPILFYQEFSLYEDELADNGTSELTLKFRCMPSGFFALLRFYIRVDFVWVSIKDVRFHWRVDRPSYILREFRTRQKAWSELDEQERSLVRKPAELYPTLKLVEEESRAEKLILY